MSHFQVQVEQKKNKLKTYNQISLKLLWLSIKFSAIFFIFAPLKNEANTCLTI